MYTFYFSLFDNAPIVWFLDHVSGISNGDDPKESKETIESELVMAHVNSLTSKLDLSGPLDLDKPLWSVFYNCVDVSNQLGLWEVHWCFHLNWTPPFFCIQIIYRDDHLPHEDLTTHFDKDADTEVILCINIHKLYLSTASCDLNSFYLFWLCRLQRYQMKVR